MLGAVAAPGAGIPREGPRTYDFAPGGVRFLGDAADGRFSVLSVRWHGSVIHSVSGSPANHNAVPERRGRRP